MTDLKTRKQYYFCLLPYIEHSDTLVSQSNDLGANTQDKTTLFGTLYYFHNLGLLCNYLNTYEIKT